MTPNEQGTLAVLAVMFGFGCMLWLGRVFRRLQENARWRQQGYDIAVAGGTLEFCANRRMMKHAEKGWKAGLTFIALKKQREEGYKAKLRAVQSAVDAGNVSGALELIGEPAGKEKA